MDYGLLLELLGSAVIIAIAIFYIVRQLIEEKTCCYGRYGIEPNCCRGRGFTTRRTVLRRYVDNTNDIEIGGYTDNNVGVGGDLLSGTVQYSTTHDYGDTNSYIDNNNYEDRNSDEHTESGVGEDLATGFASAVTDMFSPGTNDYGGDSNSYGGGDTNNDDGGGDVIED